MTAKQWKTTINKALKELGNDGAAYASVVSTLAGILEQRDAVFERYLEEGAEPVQGYTNRGGSTNTVKNPLVLLWDDLNKTALAYWRELGLTPSSYRKITGDPPKRGKPGGLAAALRSVEAG